MKRLLPLLLIISFYPLKGQIAIQFNDDDPKEVDNLIGFNTGFDHRHWVEKQSSGGVTSYTNIIRADLMEQVKTIHNPILRFPGGVIANFYHLYEQDFECLGNDPCTDSFAPGYGLRRNEVLTFNNGFGSVGSEYNFEQRTNITLHNNWIVTFADLVETYQGETGNDIEVIYMANVLSHFKFRNQAAQFTGDTPNENSSSLQRTLRETAHALRYLIEIRGLNVTKIEMGTELYFQTWSNNNEVNIDRFIALIPIYRKMLDQLGYDDIKIGVPFHHSHSLNPNADNWSRKLADVNYHDQMMYDAWVIHDYQRMVEPCNVIIGNCNLCSNWVDDECSLYDGNPNIINCEPDNHSPSSLEMETVFELKNQRFSRLFNQGLAEEYHEILRDLRALSGKPEAPLWMTEWNQVFDAGCDQWKGINKFFPNTFAHGVNIFEMLHSFYDRNAHEETPFIETATFHTFSAPNKVYAIIDASDNPSLNATYFPFQMTSLIHEKKLKKIEVDIANPLDPEELNLHSYASEGRDSIQHYYLFFSNKTKSPSIIDITTDPDKLLEIVDAKIRYIQGEALHSSINGAYLFDPKDIDVDPIDINPALEEAPLMEPYSIPSMSFGYLHLTCEKVNTILEPEIGVLLISPNPANSTLRIKTTLKGHSNLSVLDIYGRTMILKTFPDEIKHLDISRLPTGIYSLLISNSKGIQVGKFLKK